MKRLTQKDTLKLTQIHPQKYTRNKQIITQNPKQKIHKNRQRNTKTGNEINKEQRKHN